MSKRYHIKLDLEMIRGTEAVEIACNREYRTFLTTVNDKKILVTSTGIGGPSTSIAVDELAQIGVKTFVRVGSTGSIQPQIKMGDVIITTGAVRFDGASTHYAPVEFPAVAEHDVVSALIGGAKKAGVGYHTGVTASSDTFYPGEERNDSFRKYTIRRFQGSTVELQNLGVLNYEIEAATLLTMTASMNGLRGGCITGVINKGGVGKVTQENLILGQGNVIKAVALSLEELV